MIDHDPRFLESLMLGLEAWWLRRSINQRMLLAAAGLGLGMALLFLGCRAFCQAMETP